MERGRDARARSRRGALTPGPSGGKAPPAIAANSADVLAARKGSRPVASSYRITPRLHTSMLGPSYSCACAGAGCQAGGALAACRALAHPLGTRSYACWPARRADRLPYPNRIPRRCADRLRVPHMRIHCMRVTALLPLTRVYAQGILSKCAAALHVLLKVTTSTDITTYGTAAGARLVAGAVCHQRFMAHERATGGWRAGGPAAAPPRARSRAQ